MASPRWLLLAPLAPMFAGACSLAYLTDHAGETDAATAPDASVASAGPGDAAAPLTWSVWTDGSTHFADLGPLWGSSSDDVWAVGFGTIIHWNGATWSEIEGVTGAGLDGIWGSAGGDVWAVGSGGAVLHYDGTAWLPADAGTTADLTDVWGRAKDDVWATGSKGNRGVLLHWDGVAWSTVLDAGAPLGAVWGTPGGSTWAGGNDDLMLENTGGTWKTDVVQAGTPSNVDRIWGSGPDASVWAGTNDGLLEYGGEVWSSASGFGFQGIWGSGPANVWGVSYQGLIAHYDGARWSRVPSGVDAGLVGVWGSGPEDVWATGTRGTILHHP